MKFDYKIIILILLVVAVGYYCYSREHYNGGGFSVTSGLAYNNNAKHCFKNPYDPEDFPGYCTTIGPVLV